MFIAHRMHKSRVDSQITDGGEGLDFSEIEMRLMYRLSRLTLALEAEFTKQAETLAITPKQLLVLAAVAQNQGVNQTQLVALTQVDRSTMADLIRRMSERGLLNRERSASDSRSYKVSITDHGKTALGQGADIAITTEQQFLSHFLSHEQDRLLSMPASLPTSAHTAQPE